MGEGGFDHRQVVADQRRGKFGGVGGGAGGEDEAAAGTAFLDGALGQVADFPLAPGVEVTHFNVALEAEAVADHLLGLGQRKVSHRGRLDGMEGVNTGLGDHLDNLAHAPVAVAVEQPSGAVDGLRDGLLGFHAEVAVVLRRH